MDAEGGCLESRVRLADPSWICWTCVASPMQCSMEPSWTSVSRHTQACIASSAAIRPATPGVEAIPVAGPHPRGRCAVQTGPGGLHGAHADRREHRQPGVLLPQVGAGMSLSTRNRVEHRWNKISKQLTLFALGFRSGILQIRNDTGNVRTAPARMTRASRSVRDIRSSC